MLCKCFVFAGVGLLLVTRYRPTSASGYLNKSMRLNLAKYLDMRVKSGVFNGLENN